MNISIAVVLFLLVAVVFILGIAFIYLKRSTLDQKVKVAEETAKRLVKEAEREAEAKKKEALIEAKDQSLRMRQEIERESKERKSELMNMEKRLLIKEEKMEEREKALLEKANAIKDKLLQVDQMQSQLEKIRGEHIQKLEKISELSREDAKKILLDNIEKELDAEAAVAIKRNEEKIKQESEKKAKEILSSAIQRCVTDHVVETTTSTVEIPSDDMKGRIIGREGRNIRVFETLTGCDLVVDDSPEIVTVSGFSPLRRELARMTLQKLIVDGRIHPSRVEEMYKKAEQEMKNRIWELGEQAALDAGVHNLPPAIIQLLGRLRFRTSYGQNVLQHSIEVAHLSGMLADELNVNVRLARRAGLLHDIGKAIDQETEGTHPKLGATFAQKVGESPEVVHAILAHHFDEQPRTIEAVLVAVADAISASRPGARRDTLEAYVKRLEKLENVAKGFEGVEKCFAIQAGREVRVIVQPEKINDDAAIKLAHDIARKIESELEYPGEVKVTVIRETRSTEVAK